MSRLPVPGADDGTWGDVLNDFLQVELQSDGTLKFRTTVTAKGDLLAATGNAAITRLGVGADGQVLVADSTQPTGLRWQNNSFILISLPAYSKQGTLTTGTGLLRLPIDGTYTVVGTRLMVGTAPTGADIILDVKKNGTTIYTTAANRPKITAGTHAGGPGATPDVTALAAGDYLTVDVVQVGSGVAGSDLTVVVVVNKTVP